MSVQVAFQSQAAICIAAGAPFTGRLCRLVAERLVDTYPLGRRILHWGGNPSHEGDALPLRLMGGLHALARSGSRPQWSRFYPPHVEPVSDDELWSGLETLLVEDRAALWPWLDHPPQTNEVGRSAPLMAGLMVLSSETGMPVSLYELGASAGLNSRLDLYGYQLGGLTAGRPGSPVQLNPEWTGQPPPQAAVRVSSRQAVDQHPLDVMRKETRDLLSAYVWADHRERLMRLEGALDLARTLPVKIEAMDAAVWLEQRLSLEPVTGVCRVVMHTIAYQYFSPDSQARIRDHMKKVGARATEQAPLAWLSFEAHEGGGSERRPALTLQIWPGGKARTLAICQPHGALVEWMD